MPTCKGCKNDGTRCHSPIVMENGYCRAHRGQATRYRSGGSWSRERLQEVISAHGGPEGLYLAGADLSDLNLAGMDLHGIVLTPREYEFANSLPPDITDTKLSGANLRRANLKGAELGHVDLANADLRGADLEGTLLYRSDLTQANLLGANLRGAVLDEACLVKANLWAAQLQGASLSGTDLRGATLRQAELDSANLFAARLQDTDLREASLKDVDLSFLWDNEMPGVRLYQAKLDHTLLRREQLGERIWEEEQRRFGAARVTYLALKQNFDDLGDYEASSWAYVKERQMEKACSAPRFARKYYGRRELGEASRRDMRPGHDPRVWWFYIRHTHKWLSDWLVELVCNYGEGPCRTLATMAVVFVLFAAVYWATWAVLKVEGTQRIPTRNSLDIVIFSLGAFTTMDPNTLEPAAPWVELVAGFEALLGIGLTGLLGFVWGNRIRRS